MDSNLVNNLTKQAIDELRLLPIKHKSRVIQKNLVMWETELFPLLQDVGLPIYPFLLEKIFKPAGFDVPSMEDKEAFQRASDNLRGTVSSVRKRLIKKGLLKPSGAVVALPGVVPGQSQSVAVQPSIGGVGSSSPAVALSHDVVGMTPAVVTQEPVAVVGDSVVMADSKYGFNIPAYVVRADSVVAPADFDLYSVELDRLRAEKEDGFKSSWSGVDETIYLEFRKELFDFSYMQYKDSEKFDMNGYLKLYLKKVFKNKYDEDTLEHYSLLLQKLRVQSR